MAAMPAMTIFMRKVIPAVEKSIAKPTAPIAITIAPSAMTTTPAKALTAGARLTSFTSPDTNCFIPDRTGPKEIANWRIKVAHTSATVL